MKKNYGYRYFKKSREKKVRLKKVLIIGLIFALQLNFAGFLLVAPAVEAQSANGDLCAVPVDVVLVMDRSGSMGDSSKCVWLDYDFKEMEWIWQTDYNVSEEWCNGKESSTWTEYNPTKMAAAKQTANDFLSLMGSSDQSALISFANNATLDKELSGNHAETQSAVSALTVGGATNIGGAIAMGIQELDSKRANPQAVKAMILLTDGKANKPSGDGSGENPADVAYAEAQASIAAGYGFKIFTIGLGSDDEINQTMLHNIAATTDATYYHAPTQNDLSAIYNSIALALCQYGSISGCKYSDTNNDGAIAGEPTIAGWPIILNGNETAPQFTDADGCYLFSGLLPGEYTVSEGAKDGVDFSQTYPESGSYAFTLNENEQKQNINFGNYIIPADEPSAGSISGCKWNDENGNGIWEGPDNPPGNFDPDTYENELLAGWEIVLKKGGNILAATMTSSGDHEYGCFKFEGLEPGEYEVSETPKAGWIQTFPGADKNYVHNVTVEASTTIKNLYFGNYQEEVCDNTISGYKSNYFTDAAVAGVEIILEDAEGGVIATTTTNENGWYQFTGLCEGDYIVRENLPFGWVQISPADYHEATLPQAPFCIAAIYDGCIPSILSYDFVNKPLICGTKYDNRTNDPIKGWGIELSVTTGVIEDGNGAMSAIMRLDETETDDNGNYCFDISDYEGIEYENYFVITEEFREGWDAHGDTSVTEYFDGSAPLIIDFYNSEIFEEPVPGCTDPAASNYNPNATVDDGSCRYSSGGSSGSFLRYTDQGSGALTPAPEVLGEEGEPVLTIMIVAERTVVNPGDKNNTFTVVVSNHGNLTAFDTVVTATLPDGLTLSDGTGAVKTWDAGDLAPTESLEFMFLADTDENAAAETVMAVAKAVASNHDEVDDSEQIEIRIVKVLAETGFAARELALIIGLIMVFPGLAGLLRKKYAIE